VLQLTHHGRVQGQNDGQLSDLPVFLWIMTMEACTVHGIKHNFGLIHWTPVSTKKGRNPNGQFLKFSDGSIQVFKNDNRPNFRFAAHL